MREKKFVLKINWRHELRDAAFIVVGSAVCGAAYAMFLIPHHIVSGGVGGISIIINYLTGLPMSLFYVVINIPIFFLGLRGMGKRYALKSLAGILAVSGFIFLFDNILQLQRVTKEIDIILSAIYGGALLGLGLGIVFRGHGSTGGTDIGGQFLAKHTNISVGGWILIIDLVIIGSWGIIFGTLAAPLYGVLALVINSKVIDLVLEGFSYARAAHIITSKPQEVSWAIALEMRRGVTSLQGHSYFSGVSSIMKCNTLESERDFVILRMYALKIPTSWTGGA